MKNILFTILILFQIIIISTEEAFQILSDTGEKGTSLTSFTNDLFLISSSKICNIINKNFNFIKDNKDNIKTQNHFSNNFEIVESSINRIKNESIILIGENSGNKINLYSFNMTAPVEGDTNPKLLDSINSVVDNSKFSLIKIGNDKYLLSYILTGNKFENKVFKYTSYEGYKSLGKFENSGNVYNCISCFLLYEQIPICFYLEKRTSLTGGVSSVTYYQNLIALDTIIDKNYAITNILEYMTSSYNIYYNKAIYLSNDYFVFCYVTDANDLYFEIRQLLINQYFIISIEPTTTTANHAIADCTSNINKIDLIKVDDDKFLIGCTKINNKPIIKLITLNNDNSLDIKDFNLNQNVKSTLTLFTHRISNYNNYGIIFNDLNDNKLKYGYLNLPKCTNIINKDILKLNLEENAENKFKLSDYLEISIENPYVGSIIPTDYKIISFISIDNDTNIFNYTILKYSGEQKINIGNTISKDEELIIKPISDSIFSSGKFYIEVAPIIGNIQGRSCKFEFNTICYESCSTCKKYDNRATEISKHNCLSCKSNYYSLSDLCLKDCSLIKGYHNVFKTKECIYEELEFVNDCTYKIWYIEQEKEINFCSYSSFCPENIPYVYNSTGECIELCRYSELVSADCYISNIIGAGEDALRVINTEISLLGDDIFEKNDENKINKSIVIYGNNITIEISDSQKIKNDINYNQLISEFNFTECESKLRETKNIPDDKELIIVKIELRRNDTISTQIEYEIFDSTTKKLLDLSSCSNITIESPIYVNQSYSNKIKEIYDEGYDIFDINEKFYSDLCVPFHDKNFNADLTLEKRQIVYYNYNSNLCEIKCKYIRFDIEKFKAICECPVKNEINLDISQNNIFDYIEESDQKIYYKETISNLKTAKCFKIIFSPKGFKYNWGSYFMMLMIIGFIIFIIFWFKKGEEMILLYIREILDIILMRLDSAHREKVKKKFEEMIKSNNNKKTEVLNDSKESNEIKENEENNINENMNIDDKDIINSENKKIDKEKEIFRKKGPKKNAILIRSIGLNKENKMKQEVLIPEKKEKKINYSDKLNDIEKDLLSYDEAKTIDERDYYGYYWSLLKYRHLILFTFFSYDDYNFIIIKIIAFFLLLSLNLVYNFIFFFDKVINEIYDNKGKYSIKIQFLNIFICSVIFSLTIVLIRIIITSHKKYIKLKHIDNYEMAQKESYSIHKKLVIRYIIFIAVEGILLLFFWYYITAFCAVFH